MNHTLERLNKLQVSTWNMLKINDTSVAIDLDGMPAYAGNPLQKNYSGLQISREPAFEVTENPPASLRDIKGYIAAFCNYRLYITIPAGFVAKEPIVLDFHLDGSNAFLSDELFICAEAGSSATIVIRYASDGGANCIHCGYTTLHVNADANIRLIKAQRLAENHTSVDATEVNVDTGAAAHVVLIEGGAEKSVSGCSVQLAGIGASADLDGAYAVNRERALDFNYRIEYKAKNTQGNINVRGALFDKARKTAKSTLDFLPGAAGAKGREEESVMVLGSDTINLSAPLLLCGEDDVEGQHATTTGKIDENKLFYLMSRGIEKREARKLIAMASFNSVLEKIVPDSLREDISLFIQEVLDNAN
ncbi:Iron-regulated ABC transporter permease protein SufD [Lacrimispora sphenoides]|jgi:Fe-S cluster assembly scaffold protein SufB|uniref:SufD family Fe-S cluster assembly protein n=1 Tax=Lacrimispora sphenoides TaxID=29370 RepID=UPI0008B1E28F|nr:SufD family Fe-S cluster assembly protein [Lacrimispora sphenoides]SEU32628.1 Iron-regulated ABC transporter permease protein SufD [Lacrimispora sphenoides]